MLEMIFWKQKRSLTMFAITRFDIFNPNQTKLFSQSNYQGGVQSDLWTVLITTSLFLNLIIQLWSNIQPGIFKHP